LDDEVQDELEMPEYTEDELRDIDKDALKAEIAVIEGSLPSIPPP